MFVRTIEPAFYDTDALGHVNNTRLPAWFELARNDLFKLFTPDLDPRRWRLIMARMEIDYRAELHYGTDIEIRTYLSRLGNSSFTVTQEAHQSGTLTNVDIPYWSTSIMRPSAPSPSRARCAKPWRNTCSRRRAKTHDPGGEGSGKGRCGFLAGDLRA
ncbi:thioesterase superfamily protein [Halomonas elongata]|uniref:Thioesterase superfamily protein n=1 Tax=Halomonas elongata TaxID=2746 RepID=A0A1B8P6Y8_HALEL|nr:thioesterase superfamily protein [Halomonas elongata]